MASAASGDVDRAAQIVFDRIKAEESIVDRILGLREGSVELVGSLAYLKALIRAAVELNGSKKKPVKKRSA